MDSGVGIAQSIKISKPIQNHLKSVVLSKPPPDSLFDMLKKWLNIFIDARKNLFHKMKHIILNYFNN